MRFRNLCLPLLLSLSFAISAEAKIEFLQCILGSDPRVSDWIFVTFDTSTSETPGSIEVRRAHESDASMIAQNARFDVQYDAYGRVHVVTTRIGRRERLRILVSDRLGINTPIATPIAKFYAARVQGRLDYPGYDFSRGAPANCRTLHGGGPRPAVSGSN